jgi:HemY protein
MIRSLVILVLLVATVIAAAWMADNPGAIAVEWRGYRVETSIAFAFAGLALFAIAVVFADRLWRFLRSLPRWLREGRAEGRTRRGFRAVIRGLDAAAAGNVKEAEYQAKRAAEMLDASSLPLVLSARVAEINGRDDEVRETYSRLSKRKETAQLGLRGLIELARAEGDTAKALALAERARSLDPEGQWVAAVLFDLQVRSRQWREAEATLKRRVKRAWVSEEEGKHRAAVLLLAESDEQEAAGKVRAALKLTRKAHALDPSAPQATVRLAALLVRRGREGRAEKAVEEAWAANPHPALVRAYADIRPDEDPLIRVRRFEKLLGLRPGQPVVHLALAAAAMDAQLWAIARRHLGIAEGMERSATLFRLYAELERKEHGDEVAAERWLARAAEESVFAPWVCAECGARAREFTALCPACGAFDRMTYKGAGRVVTEGRPATLSGPARAPLAAPAAAAASSGAASLGATSSGGPAVDEGGAAE